MNAYQTFISLLYEAYQASEAVDFYDLRSDVPDSDAIWQTLLTDQQESFITLVNHVQSHADEIKTLSKAR